MKKLIIVAAILIAVVGAFVAFQRSRQNQVNAAVKARLDEVIALAKDEMTITYDKLEKAANDAIIIKKVSVLPKGEAKPLQISEVIFRNVDIEHDIPRFMNLSLNGFELSPETLEMDAEMFNSLGLTETMTINVVFDYRLDGETQTLNINAVELTADGLGKLSLTGQIDHLNADALEVFLDKEKLDALSESENMQLFTDVTAIEFKNASVIYTDNSLVEKILSAISQDEGISLEDLITEATLGFEEIYPEFGLSTPMPDLKAFLEKPKQLELRAEPEEPIRFGDLMMGMMVASDLPNMLNLAIVTETN